MMHSLSGPAYQPDALIDIVVRVDRVRSTGFRDEERMG